MKDEKIVKGDKEDKYVEGLTVMSYGDKRKFNRLQAPREMEYKGNNMVAKLPQNQETDPYFFILKNMLTDWSLKKNITLENIENVKDPELGKLMDEFVEEVMEINDLNTQQEQQGPNEV